MKTLKSSKKRLEMAIFFSSNKYYKTLDELILNNWLEMCSGKIEYTRKYIKKGNAKHDHIAFELLYNKYLEEYGLDETSEKILKTKARIVKLRAERVLSGDKFIENYIAIELINLADLEKEIKQDKERIETTLLRIQIALGLPTVPNKYKITLPEYKSLEQLCQSQSKKQM
jgi:hypothetical protein